MSATRKVVSMMLTLAIAPGGMWKAGVQDMLGWTVGVGDEVGEMIQVCPDSSLCPFYTLLP